MFKKYSHLESFCYFIIRAKQNIPILRFSDVYNKKRKFGTEKVR